jgi:hypothetical protein
MSFREPAFEGIQYLLFIYHEYHFQQCLLKEIFIRVENKKSPGEGTIKIYIIENFCDPFLIKTRSVSMFYVRLATSVHKRSTSKIIL